MKDFPIGLLIAIAIFFLWGISLFLILPLDLSQISSLEIVPIVWLRTFLHTGLFIIAHDCIHRSVLPKYPQGNDAIGKLAIALYACLSYERCRTNHWLHHRYTGQIQDPDVGNGLDRHPIIWYVKFMGEYLDPKQSIVISIYWLSIFAIAVLGLGINFNNLILFWGLPSILSSMQLFCFGTYLPHRGKTHNKYEIESLEYPWLLSLLACYHFGYHSEHHQYPLVPWYRLPKIRKERINFELFTNKISNHQI